MSSLGKHILLDLYDCVNADSSLNEIKAVFENGLNVGNFTVITSHHHQFEPHGLSGVFVLAESHCSFHIWTELNFVSLDVYWCGKNCDEQKLINMLIKYFNPNKVDFKYIERGSIG